MGKRQRELRVELEKREKEAANGLSSPPFGAGRGGLGAGGEARVAAAKLDELRKKGEAERQRQSADWSVKSANAKSASAKKRRSSGLSGASGGDDDGLEERTLRVKWKTKKESHSDYTLDVLFTRFGVVQSVSIEEGRGDRALVVFASAASADAAMAAYGDRESTESMRTSYVGKRRPKRSAFAPRRHTMSPQIPAGGDGEEESLTSFRDRESVVMMNLRKEGERQALMRKMVDEEGLAMDSRKGRATGSTDNGAVATASAPPTTGARASGIERGGGSGDPPGKGAATTAVGLDPAHASEKREDGVETTVAPVAPASGVDRAPNVTAGSGAARINRPAFPVPSPMTPRVATAPNHLKARRKSDVLLPSMVGSDNGCSVSGVGAPGPATGCAFGIGSKSMPTTPVSGGGSARIDEGDILSRMMAMKR